MPIGLGLVEDISLRRESCSWLISVLEHNWFYPNQENKANALFPVDKTGPHWHAVALMKQKKHRVWTSEEKIIRAIDRNKAKASRCQTEIALLSLTIKSCQDLLSSPEANETVRNFLTAKINAKNKEFDQLQKKQARAQGTLPGLKRTLAAFRTKTFDFMGDYKGVVSE